MMLAAVAVVVAQLVIVSDGMGYPKSNLPNVKNFTKQEKLILPEKILNSFKPL